jgi:olefin beta-lactone synthetase
LKFIENGESSAPALVERRAEDHALITFTTGSTGRPKGADRNHGILSTQHLLSRLHGPEIPGEIDMPAFPMIGFQNLSCGITTLLPAFDNSDLSTLRPSVITNQVLENKVTRLSAAPFLLKIVAENLESRNLKAENVRSLIAGGAPVPVWLCEKLTKVFPNAAAYVVYGSTEAEPISYISMNEIISSSGDGYLVGRPLDVLKVRIEEQGEIVIHGPHVVRGYLNNEKANRETKFTDQRGLAWHRTGDTGYFDDRGRLWLTGRLADRIHYGGSPRAQLILEQKLESISGISRAAVLNSNDGDVVAFIETKAGYDKHTVRESVLKSGPGILGLELRDAFLLEKLPVDRRHRWKIDRHALRSSLSARR